MKIVYAGTPMFAVPTLEALLAHGHSIAAVYTQPDRPAGRGRQLSQSPVKQHALAHGLDVRQPTTLRGAETELATLQPDVMVVVAYGLLLPRAVLDIPRHGCINVHASLLPRWRGAAPIARAIEAGDTDTGVSIMQMEAGLDTGPVFLTRATPILDSDTAATLEPRLADIGAHALIETLERLVRGEARAHPQDNAHTCYAAKLTKTEAALDWTRSAPELHRKIRAFHPYPIATTTWRGQALRIWNAASPQPSTNAAPGTVVAIDPQALRIQTGDGVLPLTQLQAPGGKALGARDFLNGVRINVGDRLGT